MSKHLDRRQFITRGLAFGGLALTGPAEIGRAHV